MLILHAIHSLAPETGGPAEGLRRIAHCALDEGIYESEIVCLNSLDEPYLKSETLPVHALGSGLGKYGGNRLLDRWLQDNVGRFDGVVLHGLWQYHTLAAWRACRGRVPYVVFSHGMLDPWFNRTYPLKHLKKALYWAAIEHRVLRDAAAVMFTASLEGELAKTSFRPNAWTSVIVPYGTVSPEGDRRQQISEFYRACPQLSTKRFMLFLGRLHEKKGCDLLIEAFARYVEADAETDLVVAGPDQQGWKSKLEQLAADLGIGSRVHFPGMLQGDAKWGAFYAAEVFVLPSHQENFGIAVAEALACGTPVLVSNKVNIWQEIVADGVGLAGEDDLAGVAELLDRWRLLSPGEKTAMAARCRGSFERRFDIAKAPRVIADLLMKAKQPSYSSQACSRS